VFVRFWTKADIGRPRLYARQQLADIYVRNELVDGMTLKDLRVVESSSA
jgi:hypothetical protein